MDFLSNTCRTSRSSDESGRPEAYVQLFSGGESRWLVSVNEGTLER
jgi:hypothetical protein